MAKLTSTATYLLLVLAFFLAGVISTPIVDYPKVVPGPGLPSLDSFNVTSADLYQTGLEFMKNFEPPDTPVVAKRWNDFCSFPGLPPCDVNDAYGCLGFLIGPAYSIEFSASSAVLFVDCGDCSVFGIAAPGISGYTSAIGNDVAQALAWSMEYCQWAGLTYPSTGAFAAAYGNGNLIIRTGSTDAAPAW